MNFYVQPFESFNQISNRVNMHTLNFFRSLINLLVSGYPSDNNQNVLHQLLAHSNRDCYLALKAIQTLDAWPIRHDLVQEIQTIASRSTTNYTDTQSIITYQALLTLGHVARVLSLTGDWAPVINGSNFVENPSNATTGVISVILNVIASQSAVTTDEVLFEFAILGLGNAYPLVPDLLSTLEPLLSSSLVDIRLAVCTALAYQEGQAPVLQVLINQLAVDSSVMIRRTILTNLLPPNRNNSQDIFGIQLQANTAYKSLTDSEIALLQNVSIYDNDTVCRDMASTILSLLGLSKRSVVERGTSYALNWKETWGDTDISAGIYAEAYATNDDATVTHEYTAAAGITATFKDNSLTVFGFGGTVGIDGGSSDRFGKFWYTVLGMNKFQCSKCIRIYYHHSVLMDIIRGSTMFSSRTSFKLSCGSFHRPNYTVRIGSIIRNRRSFRGDSFLHCGNRKLTGSWCGLRER